MEADNLSSRLWRLLGWLGLGLLLLAMFLADFLAHAPAGSVAGPPLLAPSARFPFGTDGFGHDVLSETLHGLAQTGRLGLAAALTAILLGGVFGVVAARLPRNLALFMRRVFAILASVPALLLTILMAGLWGQDFLALWAGLASVPAGFLRSFDHADLNAAHSDYALATGIPALTMLERDLTYEFRFFLGEVVARALAAVVIIVSTASFLGFGGAGDLGAKIAAAKPVFFTAWWSAFFPAMALILFVLSARLAAGLDQGERA